MWTEPEHLFYAILSSIWIEFAWNLFLSFRQNKMYHTAREVPQELKGMFDTNTYDKARLYGLDINRFLMAMEIYEVGLITAIFLLRLLPRFWQCSRTIITSTGFPSYEILQSVVFIFICNLFSTIANLPIALYYTFVLEEAYGFNKQRSEFFLVDIMKDFIVTQILMLPLLAAIIAIVRTGGTYFYVYLWVFSTVLTFLLLTVYPNWVAPLYDDYTELPEGELRERIQELAASLEFPLAKIYVVQGSKQSAHSNAYFFGFFKNKRIALSDTLLKDYVPVGQNESEKRDKGCDNEEVLAILAHELGHWKFNHNLKFLIFMEVNLFLEFAAFGWMFNYAPMYQAFGFPHEKPVLIGLLIVLEFIFLPYHTVLKFAMMTISRRFEFQADEFAKSLGKAEHLSRALIKVHEDNLTFPVYDWLYSMFHHSHPPLLERLRALDHDKRN